MTSENGLPSRHAEFLLQKSEQAAAAREIARERAADFDVEFSARFLVEHRIAEGIGRPRVGGFVHSQGKQQDEKGEENLREIDVQQGVRG